MSIDTIRADRIGCYGRENAGTPHLDALAARGARFADAMAPAPVTLPSHATLLTGRDPLHHGIRHNGLFALPPAALTLAERLSAAGFRAGGFVASMALAERHGLNQGFETYTSPGRGSGPGLFYLGERAAADVNRDALAWIDSIGAEPFFLFVHYMEPHAPLHAPEPERSRFPEDPYQAEIAAADRALGELLAALDARGRLARTLVVVAGDHGEALGDHGELSHGIFLYQPTLRVPLIAAGPGVRAGVVVEEPVGLVDVTPTLLEAADLEAEDLDGRSLWPALAGGSLDADRALYAESFVGRYDLGWSELRALRKGDDKYVQAPRPELYTLTDDPDESHNLVAARPERARELARELADRVAREEGRGEPPERITLSPAQRSALERLGYLSGSHGGRASGPLPDPKDHIQVMAALDWASQRMQEGRYEEGERVLREVVAREPGATEARLRLVTALALQRKHREAAAEAQRLIDAAQDRPEADVVAARARVYLGDSLLWQRRFADAAREYEQAIVTPQPTRVYETLGTLYIDLGRRDDALRVLRELERRGDPSPRSRELLAYLEGRGPLPRPAPPPSDGDAPKR